MKEKYDDYLYSSDWEEIHKNISEETDKNIAKNRAFLDLYFSDKLKKNKDDKSEEETETKKDEEKIETETKTKSGEQKSDKENKSNLPSDKITNLDMHINLKTGECIIKDGDREFKTEIISEAYSKQGLESLKKCIEQVQTVAEEDKKYLDKVDPTIYNAYLMFDGLNKGKYSESAAEMYVNSVIAKQKQNSNDNKSETKMPGKVTIDIGYHPKQKNKQDEDVKFNGIKGLFQKLKARKFFKNHGAKNMNLATVKDNRWKFFAITGITALLAGGTISLSEHTNKEDTIPIENQEDEKEKDKNDDFNKDSQNEDKTPVDCDKDKNDDFNKDSQNEDKAPVDYDKDKNDDFNKDNQNEESNKKDEKENNVIHIGDILNIDRYALLYISSDSITPSGAIGNDNQRFGVNKIACVIDGNVISTNNYSEEQVIKKAEEAGVELRYHIDNIINIDGKNCVQIKEVGNPSNTYIYRDTYGIIRYSDGRVFDGDIESGIGWVNAEDCKKTEKTLENAKNSNSKYIEKETKIEDFER